MRSDKKERDSNIELLRLLCMLMVVTHHFLVRGVFIPPWTTGLSIGWDTVIGTLLDQFCYCAVDVFILISGYFGIKCKVRGIAALYVRCALIGLLCWIVGTAIDGGSPGRHGFTMNCLLSLSHTRWFIAAYLCLYLLSPILNICIEHLSKEKFIFSLILLTVLNVYFGWFQGAKYNATGYCAAQFIYLYFIGRYISIYGTLPSRKKSLVIYISCAILLGLTVLCIYSHNNDSKWVYLFGEKYNNPILIIEAASLLLFFRTLSFSSRAVNWLAESTIAIYLIHTNPNIDERIYACFSEFWKAWPDGGKWFFLIFSSIALSLGCIAVDKVLQFIVKPATSLLTKIGEKVVNQISILVRKLSCT